MEHSTQDRQFKSKFEEDWMIMNIYTVLLTIAVYAIIYLISIRFWGNRLEKFLKLQVGQTGSWLNNKFNTITQGRPGTSVVQHLTRYRASRQRVMKELKEEYNHYI